MICNNLFSSILFLSASFAFAGDKNDHKPPTDTNNNYDLTAESQGGNATGGSSDNHAINYATGGAGGFGGSSENYNANNYTTSNTTTFNQHTAANHVTPILGERCVGEACASSSSIFVTGGRDDIGGNTVRVGFAIPLGNSIAKKAMRSESRRIELQNQNLQLELEKRQAELSLLCMQMHEKMEILGTPSQEIKTRCASFAPPNNHIKTGQAHRHNLGGSPDQASPHRN